MTLALIVRLRYSRPRAAARSRRRCSRASSPYTSVVVLAEGRCRPRRVGGGAREADRQPWADQVGDAPELRMLEGYGLAARQHTRIAHGFGR